ncbi:GntR family transcriptional regulator [Marinomonas rhizomae]|uniref:GntR family transcriptional regulator n=1 Tax=Marinomonas rhizomae TaxID=491948 RepID=A0A366JF68_9GAMM|nr:GntR family transcriptional regulator [Marinomonas rhizomae]RBP85110.1 GntR family transcriptional regulator [Marinomonas rhizomae]RNF76218.1 GntR family transcriptional regulator [Marinomonas rhizomae]
MAQKRAVVRQSLPDVIATDLRNRILSGDLAEGSLIRQELLAEEYDVSRMPVREALKRLDSEGLVVFINNRGATVTKHSLDEIAEFFDVRILLEVDLLKKSIPLMDEHHFDRCRELLDEMEASYAAGNVADWGPLNAQYHAMLYEAANQKLTMQLLERVSMLANRYVSMHIDQLSKADNAEHDHRSLFNLARLRDVDGAADLLKAHLENTKQQILELIAATRSK